MGDFLFAHLSALAARSTAGAWSAWTAEPDRDNIFAVWGEPRVTLSTHMDTVPPFFASREDGEFIWGRGSCDAKGIIAAMMAAAERLARGGRAEFRIAFCGGGRAKQRRGESGGCAPRGSRFLINGEPTENRLALGSKGALRFRDHRARETGAFRVSGAGHSAIHTLLDVLQDIRRIPLPEDALLGTHHAECRDDCWRTRAERGGGSTRRRKSCFGPVGESGGDARRQCWPRQRRSRGSARSVCTRRRCGFRRSMDCQRPIVAFATDIPMFDGAWGEPFLIGPGSIHLAHTPEERIPRKELTEAVDFYARMVQATTSMATGAERAHEHTGWPSWGMGRWGS